MVPLPVGILLSCNLFLYHSKRNKFITTAITFAHFTLALIWVQIWEACEILNLEHGSIACWYSFVMQFISLSFQKEQIYYNGNNFCAFYASLRSEYRFEKLVKFWTWDMVPLPVGILLSCNLFLYHSKRNKFITTAITFAHLTLASIWVQRFEKLVKFWT